MKILFIAPLPPPVHGSAMVSQYIKDSKLIQEQYDCDFVNLSTSRRMDEIGKGGMKKILRFIGAYFSLLWKLLTRRYDLCYLAITCHDMGFLKDAPFVLLCKLFRRKVLIHQHNKGMSGCVERWPYRWLLPLVYRNTTVMLLSWHLYDDIAKVVKREQVVVCANGIPQITDNGQQTKATKLLSTDCHPDGDTKLVGEDENENSQSSSLVAHCSSLSNSVQDNLTQNSRNPQNGKSLRPCCHPDGNTNPYTLHTKQEISHTDFTDYTDGKSLTPLLVSGVSAEGQQPIANSQEPSAPRLLFLSNLIPSKGVYVLLDACRILRERGLTFVCDFVGGETKEIDRAAFEAAVRERGLESIVCYHGPKYGEEKEEHWRRADIFVFPTFYFNECFPLVLLEAMQWRLPLVSSDEGGIPDIVKDGVNGYVCQRQDVQSLAEALERLITDPALRQQMGERGYQRYLDLYTLEAFEKRFVEQLLAIG